MKVAGDNLKHQKQLLGGVLKKSVLKILQNSHENTCARVSFFNKVAVLRLQRLLKDVTIIN